MILSYVSGLLGQEKLQAEYHAAPRHGHAFNFLVLGIRQIGKPQPRRPMAELAGQVEIPERVGITGIAIDHTHAAPGDEMAGQHPLPGDHSVVDRIVKHVLRFQAVEGLLRSV